MKIAVWTTNPAKIKAIQEGLEKIVYLKDKEFEIIPLKVSSDVSDMPISLEENIQGAKNRAYNCKKEIEADLYVGMEWWTTLINWNAFLFGVVYLVNKEGEEHFGISNMIKVPEYFRQKIYDEWKELGPVLSEVTKEENASKKWGAFWHWTDNMLTRTDQFVLAFISAIVPFYNKYYKM